MIALLQRVRHAQVQVLGEVVGQIQAGLLVLVGIERGDTEREAQRLLTRTLNYRLFNDDAGKMNRSLADTQGGLLLVSQFTLAADTDSGNRPSFTPAALPAVAQPLFEGLVRLARAQHPFVQTGVFAADMQVSLCNDGPVTFWLQVPPVLP
jgi:D-tyrosyl-tRNA(Tyr) deacylase